MVHPSKARIASEKPQKPLAAHKVLVGQVAPTLYGHALAKV
jgi:hypothetical protein